MSSPKFQKLDEKLRQKEIKLGYLLDITTAINSNESQDRLLQIYQFILKEQLGIARLLLFYHRDDWKYILKYGYKGKVSAIRPENDLIQVKDITVIESSSKDLINAFDVVIPVYHKDRALAYLLLGDEDEEEIGVSPAISHMQFIQTLTNIIIVAIENKKFAKEVLEKERVKRELEVAGEMQSLLFPSNLPSDERHEIAGSYLSHNLVGGDYYDYIRLNENDFMVCIADVSGKGVSAALLMSNFQANLRAIFNYTSLPLPELIRELNEKVFETAQGEKFITFFIGIYNFFLRELRYVNAGHNPPILTDGNESVLLKTGCTGLGMFEGIPSIEEGVVEVDPNSILMLYTDGLVEIENEKGDVFDTDKIISLIHAHYNEPMDSLNEHIFNRLDRFRGDEPFIDDTAVLSCRIR